MMFAGCSLREIQEKHGGCVLKEARFNWHEYWETVSLDSEGHAHLN